MGSSRSPTSDANGSVVPSRGAPCRESRFADRRKRRKARETAERPGASPNRGRDNEAMNRQTAVAGLFVIAVIVGSCTGGRWNRGSAWIRNESGESVEVSINYRGQGFLGGDDQLVLNVPPWREGWCNALGRGINPGEATISVRGPSVPFPITTTITVPSAPDDNISVLVDAAGEVHFGIAEPPPK